MLRTNFLKTALASMLVVCATAFYSCDSDGEEPETPPADESSIVGKWEVQSTETRAAGDTKYGSFEFTEDNRYIITQPTTVDGKEILLVVSGEYKTGSVSGNEFTLDLKDLGIIKISITKNHASITIDGVVYVAVKAPEIALSDKDKKLIGTWKITSQYHDEDGAQVTDDEGTWTFTSAGTYLIANAESELENGTWSWKPNNVLSVSYTSYDCVLINGVEEISNIEVLFDNWKVTELTDKKFVAEIKYEDEDDTIFVFGTKQ